MLFAVATATATASASPMIVMYGTAETNRKIIRPGAADALPLDGRLFVQEPNWSHLFGGEADRPFRLARVTEDELEAARTAPAMARLLRTGIDQANCYYAPAWFGCRSRLVFVDEIDYRFAEPAPNLNTPAWRGRTSRSQPKPVFPNYVPTPRPGQLGYELGQAMAILAATPYPGDGSYAARVHFYIAPGVVSSIGVGRGRFQNLGRDRRPHFRSYEGLRGALQHAGGAWLEMYHFNRASRTRGPFNTYEWSVYPWRFALYVTGPGAAAPARAALARLHFMMSHGAPKPKGGAPAICRRGARQACQFSLAESPKNQPILANGVGQYRMEGDETEWRSQVRRRFFR